MEDNKNTNDYGEIEVQVSPIGKFYGSDKDGQPVEENISQEALNLLAEKLNSGDEVLCDVDHASCRSGVNKDSSAAGWFSKFVANAKGLFAKLKFTRRGKELAENREYRYLSPTFMLNEKGEPVDIHSISYTNTPAFKGFITPIINSEADAVQDINNNKEITDMTKEEIIELIKSTVAEMKAEEAKNEEAVEEVKEEEKAEASNECSEEKVQNECSEEKEAEVKNEEAPVEVTTEEKKEEEKEVIKMEALNSAPVEIKKDEPWKNLHGKAFFDYILQNNIK